MTEYYSTLQYLPKIAKTKPDKNIEISVDIVILIFIDCSNADMNKIDVNLTLMISNRLMTTDDNFSINQISLQGSYTNKDVIFLCF